MGLVRGPAKSSGAFGFGCLFLCFFLLGKQKKEEKAFAKAKGIKNTRRLLLFAKVTL